MQAVVRAFPARFRGDVIVSDKARSIRSQLCGQRCVPPGIAAVIATTVSSSFAMSDLRGSVGGAFSKNAFLENAFFENFAIFWRARSRLYQNEILQENMRSTAFFKLYKICILLHRCNLKMFAKNRFENAAIFVKFQQKICKCRKICKILSNFKNLSLRIW